MDAPDSSDVLSPTAEVFAEFLARVDQGEELDIETFCTRHPELSSGLRRMHRRWNVLRRTMEGAGSSP